LEQQTNRLQQDRVRYCSASPNPSNPSNGPISSIVFDQCGGFGRTLASPSPGLQADRDTNRTHYDGRGLSGVRAAQGRPRPHSLHLSQFGRRSCRCSLANLNCAGPDGTRNCRDNSGTRLGNRNRPASSAHRRSSPALLSKTTGHAVQGPRISHAISGKQLRLCFHIGGCVGLNYAYLTASHSRQCCTCCTNILLCGHSGISEASWTVVHICFERVISTQPRLCHLCRHTTNRTDSPTPKRAFFLGDFARGRRCSG